MNVGMFIWPFIAVRSTVTLHDRHGVSNLSLLNIFHANDKENKAIALLQSPVKREACLSHDVRIYDAHAGPEWCLL